MASRKAPGSVGGCAQMIHLNPGMTDAELIVDTYDTLSAAAAKLLRKTL